MTTREGPEIVPVKVCDGCRWLEDIGCRKASRVLTRIGYRIETPSWCPVEQEKERERSKAV